MPSRLPDRRGSVGLVGMFPVPLTGLDPSLSGKALRQAAAAVYQFAASQGPVRMRDGRSVELTSVGFKKIRSHSADRRVLDLLPSIRELLVAATPIGSAPPRNKPNSLPSILAYHYYGTWVTLGGGAALRQARCARIH